MAHNTECANNGGLWRGEECGGCIWVYDHLVTHPRVVIASTSTGATLRAAPCHHQAPGRGAEVNVFSFMSGEYHHHHHHHCTALHYTYSLILQITRMGCIYTFAPLFTLSWYCSPVRDVQYHWPRITLHFLVLQLVMSRDRATIYIVQVLDWFCSAST